MIVLFISVILFNVIALKMNKIPTTNRIVHIWLFTITLQLLFDLVIEFKYQAYWYFGKDIDWVGMPAHIILIPPVNIMLLSWFPFKAPYFKKAIYISCWTIVSILYEAVSLLPEPWGFFHFGWWKLWYDLIIVPILILILLGYYKWICTIEKKLQNA